MPSIAMGDSPGRDQSLESFHSLILALADQVFNLDIIKSVIFQEKEGRIT
jgi:hypothetical protein